MRKELLNKYKERGLRYGYYVSWGLLVIAAAYVAVRLSWANVTVGDQTNISYMLAGWRLDGALTFMAQHTNFMKLPFLWLQVNLFPYNFVSYAAFNVLMVSLTVVGWSWLLGRFMRDRNVILAVNVLLAGLLIGSLELSKDLTMATIRNIEYPVLLAYLLLLFGLLKSGGTWMRWCLTTSLLALLVISDFFFAYTVPLAVVGAVTFLYMRKRTNGRRAFSVATNAIVGTLSAVVLMKILEMVGVLNLIDSPRGLVAYSNFWTAVDSTIFQTLKVFGGDFFGMQIRINSLGRIGLAIFTIVSFVAIYKVCRGYAAAKGKATTEDDAFIAYTLFLVLALALGAYILSGFATPTGENNRYLTIVPFISVVFLALWLRKTERQRDILVLMSLVVLGLGMLCAPENARAFVYQRDISTPWINLDKDIISYLGKNDIKMAYGTLGYTSTTWFLSDRKVNVYNIQPCNMKNPILSTSRWYKHLDNERTALIVDRLPGPAATSETWYACSDEKIQEIYGKPVAHKVIGLNVGQPVEVYIYDYNIGSRLVDLQL